MRNRLIANLALVIAVAFFAAGCTTTLQHGIIRAKPSADNGPMGVTDRAENMTQRVGWGTITLFAIPVAPLHVIGQADRELMNQLKDAVVQAGYRVTTVGSAGSAGSTPVLSCKVQQFSFSNYTWFVPFVFNWGTIRLDVTITASDGKLLWNKTYTGKGHGFYDFDPPVKRALTNILNELANDLASAQFKTPSFHPQPPTSITSPASAPVAPPPGWADR